VKFSVHGQLEEKGGLGEGVSYTQGPGGRNATRICLVTALPAVVGLDNVRIKGDTRKAGVGASRGSFTRESDGRDHDCRGTIRAGAVGGGVPGSLSVCPEGEKTKKDRRERAGRSHRGR